MGPPEAAGWRSTQPDWLQHLQRQCTVIPRAPPQAGGALQAPRRQGAPSRPLGAPLLLPQHHGNGAPHQRRAAPAPPPGRGPGDASPCSQLSPLLLLPRRVGNRGARGGLAGRTLRGAARPRPSIPKSGGWSAGEPRPVADRMPHEDCLAQLMPSCVSRLDWTMPRHMRAPARGQAAMVACRRHVARRHQVATTSDVPPAPAQPPTQALVAGAQTRRGSRPPPALHAADRRRWSVVTAHPPPPPAASPDQA
jgi:hypothetical protein